VAKEKMLHITIKKWCENMSGTGLGIKRNTFLRDERKNIHFFLLKNTQKTPNNRAKQFFGGFSPKTRR
jgi:hypothetical protein